MAADRFTQISNNLFRDSRLSAKAMGVFGHISTHRGGFGVTPESISRHMRDGVSAIKGALQELEACGYLVRTQQRRADGTMGPVEYYITDMPPEEQIPTSEPVDEIQLPDATCDNTGNHRSEPVDGNPPAGDPPAENHPHKKTNSKKTSSKNTLSPPSPGPRPAATPAADERETEAAPPTTTAERVIRTAAVVTPDEEQQFIDWVTTRHTPRGPGWWRTIAANGDLADLAQTWRAEHAPAATGPALPAWCGQCGDGMPAAAFNPRFRRSDGQPCPDCHPDRHAA